MKKKISKSIKVTAIQFCDGIYFSPQSLRRLAKWLAEHDLTLDLVAPRL
jgi:hypothetical protein